MSEHMIAFGVAKLTTDRADSFMSEHIIAFSVAMALVFAFCLILPFIYRG